MRKTIGLSLALLLTGGVYLNSQAVTLEKGWNLKGADCSVDFQNIDNPDIKLVWRYEDGKWELFTKNETIKELAQNLGIETFTKTTPYDGFWILVGAPTVVDLCGEEGSGGYAPPEHSSRPLFRALEGDFDTVLQELGNKTEKTDEERLAYAVATLGKASKMGVLKDAGFYVIPGYGHVFKVDGEGKHWCNSTEWVSDAQNLINAINESLNELETVSSGVKIEVLSSYLEDDVSAILDSVTVDTLKALLIVAKAKLEYALAYDWKKIGELCEQDEQKEGDTLPYIEAIKIANTDYLQQAKEDFDRALKKLKEISTQKVPSMSEDDYSRSLLTWFLTDDDGDFPSQGDVADFGTNTVSGLIASLETGNNSVSNPAGSYTQTVNLKYLFDNPFDGSQVKSDAEEGKVIEKRVCTGGWEYCYEDGSCEKGCYDWESELWFTKDSYLYNYITAVFPTKTLYERSLNGTTYYTVDENEYWNWEN